jgi:hypothetical protein
VSGRAGRCDGCPLLVVLLQLTMTPIKDDQGKLVKVIGVQLDVTSKTEGNAEDEQHPVLIHYDGRWAPVWLGGVRCREGPFAGAPRRAGGWVGGWMGV